MNDSKDHKAAAEPPLDCLVGRLRAMARYEHDDLSIGDDAADEIERLRDWIRHDSEVNDTCTFHVLGEICQGCGCPRKVPNANVTGLAPREDDK